jgi:putative salt-induced outer membrane protein YdiY
MNRTLLAAATAAVVCSSFAIADTVVLSNGDTLNGKIGLITTTEMKFNSPAFGDVTIPLSKITRYTIDAPARVQPRGEEGFSGQVSGDSTSVTVDDKKYAVSELKAINPPPQEWTGALVANFALARGNTNRFVVGTEAAAALRRDDAVFNDRISFGGGYNYGESGGGAGDEDKVTDTDNWNVFGKYDRYWDDQWYGYANAKLEHDRIAALYYRVAPGVGLGYQWFETEKMKFRTEAGLTYIHEEFDPSGTNDSIAVRLAYAYDNKLTDDVVLFHTLEYLPAIDDPADYILNTDLGIRASLTDDFFAQFKILYKRDSTPAEDALKNDLLYTIGVGWNF